MGAGCGARGAGPRGDDATMRIAVQNMPTYRTRQVLLVLIILIAAITITIGAFLRRSPSAAPRGVSAPRCMAASHIFIKNCSNWFILASYVYRLDRVVKSISHRIIVIYHSPFVIIRPSGKIRAEMRLAITQRGQQPHANCDSPYYGGEGRDLIIETNGCGNCC
ncbi:hypothetical protein EVAR_21183_1 [Eumeta japonica]|uniref:Uncharacterized protein n=1 Tax=Eumeta variegata TaxID=151549 RepID=A0A4C1UNN0_EUMVA|nr:hypothetical protein EVAR_21183_1 [Eumeta japonica]